MTLRKFGDYHQIIDLNNSYIHKKSNKRAIEITENFILYSGDVPEDELKAAMIKYPLCKKVLTAYQRRQGTYMALVYDKTTESYEARKLMSLLKRVNLELYGW